MVGYLETISSLRGGEFTPTLVWSVLLRLKRNTDGRVKISNDTGGDSCVLTSCGHTPKEITVSSAGNE